MPNRYGYVQTIATGQSGHDAGGSRKRARMIRIGDHGSRDTLTRVLEAIDAERPTAEGFASGYLDSIAEDITNLLVGEESRAAGRFVSPVV